jgi:hypothetical protein
MTKMPVSIDRRRTPRTTLARPIAAWVAGLPVHLVDLGTSGARVEHDTPLGIRRELRLRFELEGTTLVLSCVVMRCRLQRSAARPGAAAYCSGVRFTAADEPSRALLNSLLSRGLPSPHGEPVDGALSVTGV